MLNFFKISLTPRLRLKVFLETSVPKSLLRDVGYSILRGQFEDLAADQNLASGIPKDKTFSNFKCELLTIKGALDNYHSREIESSSGIPRFSDSMSALQAIQRVNFQLEQDIIALINGIVGAQRTCTLQ
ncbi:hypothetical protein TNCV_3326091 [Trichonephila clavipes]|nr:hypothetical protein TNCV_3326091 [Trichonephila clavipes]